MVKNLCSKVKAASRRLMNAGTEQKNAALSAIADELDGRVEEILNANLLDLEKARQNGMNASLMDRLTLTEERVHSIASAVRELVNAQDPVGRIISGSVRPNGLSIEKVTVPLGVVAVIYEARPNVTVDSAVLCLKAGNAVILRGGKEAYNSNRLLAEVMKLPEKYRVPLHLFYYEDYSITEIAKVLDLPDATVKTRLKRGRDKLKKTLRKEDWL